jgi:metal-responsive CopG/Arc/MetJ family transcriptional regulator
MNRFLISLPDNYLEELDRAARDESRSRSDMVREAIVVMLEERRQDAARLARREAAFRDMDKLRKETGHSREDSTEIIRRFRYGGHGQS